MRFLRKKMMARGMSGSRKSRELILVPDRSVGRGQNSYLAGAVYRCPRTCTSARRRRSIRTLVYPTQSRSLFSGFSNRTGTYLCQIGDRHLARCASARCSGPTLSCGLWSGSCGQTEYKRRLRPKSRRHPAVAGAVRPVTHFSEKLSKGNSRYYHTDSRLPLTGLTAQIILFGWQRLSDLALLVWLLQLLYFICNIYHAWKGLPLTDLTVQIILFVWQCLSNLEGIATCWSGGYNYFISLAASITLERNYHLLIW